MVIPHTGSTTSDPACGSPVSVCGAAWLLIVDQYLRRLAETARLTIAGAEAPALQARRDEAPGATISPRRDEAPDATKPRRYIVVVWAPRRHATGRVECAPS